jgi:hypothetical protein
MRKSALLIEILTLLRINLRVWFETVVLFPTLFWKIRSQNIHFCVNNPQPTTLLSPANFICPICLNLSSAGSAIAPAICVIPKGSLYILLYLFGFLRFLGPFSPF